MTGQYVQWLLDSGVELYKAHEIFWRKYNGALVPANATQTFVVLSKKEKIQLLKQSKALFLRYSSNPSVKETSWWYVVCRDYDKSLLSSNTRSKVNRGRKRCDVEKLDKYWFLNNGYYCYRSAYKRYSNAKPISEVDFKKTIMQKIDGPFEWWGVFVNGQLVGYCECIIEINEVATNVIKLDPDFLKQYSSYALFDAILPYYLKKELVVSNGCRSVSHDTNMQDFFLKLGFEKSYCYLNIHYQSYLSVFVYLIYSSRMLIVKLPNYSLITKLKTLIIQEKIIRDKYE